MLTHYPSTVVVFQSSEYKNFTMINGNRSLNEKKIARIIKEIEKGNDMLQYYPIQVRVEKEKLLIIDGQHRFIITKKLKRPVHYILVAEEKSMQDVARINSNVEKWKATDFINCYITQKKPHYIKLQEFLSLYNINIGTCLKLLSNGTPGTEGNNSVLTEKFENGTFEVTHWKEAVEVAETCKLFSLNPLWNTRSFVIAVFRVKEAAKVPIETIVQAFINNPDTLTYQPNQKEYITCLERIVNKNKQKRIVII